MMVNNTVKRAPKLPQPGKTYGARVGGLRITRSGIAAEWEIFAHKTRKPKRRKVAAA